jgi:Family of unknown function (DUF5678)
MILMRTRMSDLNRITIKAKWRRRDRPSQVRQIDYKFATGRPNSIPSVENLLRKANELTQPDQLKLAALIIEQAKARTTPEEEQNATPHQLRQEHTERGQTSVRQISASISNFRNKEMSWLEEHRSEYAGRWVVIEGDKLISVGVNAREVYETARLAGIAIPFLVKVESEDQLPFGGW